jgi:hypothetical protein
MLTCGNIRIYNHQHNLNISKSSLEARKRDVPQLKNMQMVILRKNLNVDPFFGGIR